MSFRLVFHTTTFGPSVSRLAQCLRPPLVISANLISLKEWTEDSTNPLETAKDNAPKEGPPSRASSPFEAGQPSGYGLLLKAGPPPRVGLPSRAGPPYKTAPLKSSTTFRKWSKLPKTAAPARVAAPARRFVARKLRQTPVQVHGSYVKESDRFALNKDNAAKDAWRQRRQPDGLFSPCGKLDLCRS